MNWETVHGMGSMVGTRFLGQLVVGVALLSQAALAEPNEAQSLHIKNSTEESSIRPWTGEWNFEMGGESFSEGRDTGAAAYLYLRSKFDYRYSPWLRAHVRPRLDLFSSRIQEREESDEYESRVRLNEGYLSLSPLASVELRAGAISHEHLENSLLVSSHRAFPGVAALAEHKGKHFQATLMVQHLVPTSYSLNSERDSKEALPRFSTQSVHLAGDMGSNWTWRGHLGHFQWSDLPDKVAYESQSMGNRPTGAEFAAGATLASGFDGYFWGGEFCACGWAPIQGVVEYQGLVNQRTPGAFADGEKIGLGPRWIHRNFTLDLRYFHFFLESDATVARYAPKSLGYTNRIGDGIEARLDLTKYKFAIVGDWVNARTLRSSTSQQTLTDFKIGVETHYAPF